MPSARQLKVYTPWTVGLQPAWTVSGVRSALTDHEGGQFAQSAMLIDAMFRDPRLGPVVETRLKGLFGAPFCVDPADGEDIDAKATSMAEDADAAWLDMFPEADLMALWQWRLFAGFAIGELVWQRSPVWMPRLKVWHLSFAYADEEKGVYILTTREGEIEVPFGGSDGKWIVLGRGSRPWMNGLVRSLATPWLVAQWAERDWARYSERHGMPIVKAMVPAIADDDDRESFFDDVKALSTETTVQLPTALDGEGKVGFDLALVEATANTWEGFQGLLRHCHDNYAIALTGNNLTTLIEGGSFAASTEATDRLRNFCRGDGEELSTQLRKQALEWWADYNYAGGRERAPWPRWDTEPPEDAKYRAESIKLAGDALTALKDAGWQPKDIDAFAESFSLELVPVEEPDPEPLPLPMPPDREPPEEDDDDGSQDEPQPLNRCVKRRVVLASGDDPAEVDGFVAGQLYVDQLADGGVRRQKRRPDMKVVADIVEAATDYEDLRARLLGAYPMLADRDFRALIEKALILSDMAGRYAVLEDL